MRTDEEKEDDLTHAIRLHIGLRNIREEDPLPNIVELVRSISKMHRTWQGQYCIGPDIQMRILEEFNAYQCVTCGTAWRYVVPA